MSSLRFLGLVLLAVGLGGVVWFGLIYSSWTTTNVARGSESAAIELRAQNQERVEDRQVGLGMMAVLAICGSILLAGTAQSELGAQASAHPGGAPSNSSRRCGHCNALMAPGMTSCPSCGRVAT